MKNMEAFFLREAIVTYLGVPREVQTELYELNTHSEKSHPCAWARTDYESHSFSRETTKYY